MSVANYVLFKTFTSYNLEITTILGTEIDAKVNKMKSLALRILQCSMRNRHGYRNVYTVEVLELDVQCYGNRGKDN